MKHWLTTHRCYKKVSREHVMCDTGFSQSWWKADRSWLGQQRTGAEGGQVPRQGKI